jgi:hypothetical protein
VQLIQVIRGIRQAQAKQDAEGHLHPGQIAVATFDMSLLTAILLRILCIRGVEFVGCFKPRKDDGNAIQSAQP